MLKQRMRCENESIPKSLIQCRFPATMTKLLRWIHRALVPQAKYDSDNRDIKTPICPIRESQNESLTGLFILDLFMAVAVIFQEVVHFRVTLFSRKHFCRK